jgi:transketolase
MAYELWAKHMNHNPANPDWPNRDRFILSGGHGSTLLYSLLHLFGYGLTKEDLMQFRQLDSLTPGHPEYRHTRGVEATTGPLGAGMGMAVGMAAAEAHLAAKFNKEGYPVVDHYTYVLGGDGCMMEGISSEAFSLAGTLGLGKLIVLYDSNQISIEGSTDIAFTEDVKKRFEAFGFQTLVVEDGNNLEEIGKAIEEAKADKTRPTMITVKTQIGFGCPAKQGKASAHGEPLGDDNVKALKENLGWPGNEPFFVPDEVYANYRDIASAKAEVEDAWNKMFEEYCAKYPEMKKAWDEEFDLEIAKKLIDDEAFWAYDDNPEATRNLSGQVLNRLKDKVPNLVGGAADLSPSTKTYMKDMGDFSKADYAGRNMHFGVRELAMAAIGNGMTLHGLRAFVSTFFVFSDYVKPMARLSSIMKIPTTYVLTHDSIGVGEDGPTHEPIEQLAMLRSMPNFHVFRPADATETIAAWYSAVTSLETPTALVLSRQNLPQLAGSSKEALKGAYVLEDSTKDVPDAIIIATGSEVSLAVEAKAALAKDGVDVRVVSMPCMDIFEEQSEEYKESVLPKNVRARVAVEALGDFGWGKYVGLDGKIISMKGFGASAPAATLFKKFGFTTENVVAAVKAVL